MNSTSMIEDGEDALGFALSSESEASDEEDEANDGRFRPVKCRIEWGHTRVRV